MPQSLHPRLRVGTPAVQVLDTGGQLGTDLSGVVKTKPNGGGGDSGGGRDSGSAAAALEAKTNNCRS